MRTTQRRPTGFSCRSSSESKLTCCYTPLLQRNKNRQKKSEQNIWQKVLMRKKNYDFSFLFCFTFLHSLVLVLSFYLFLHFALPLPARSFCSSSIHHQTISNGISISIITVIIIIIGYISASWHHRPKTIEIVAERVEILMECGNKSSTLYFFFFLSLSLSWSLFLSLYDFVACALVASRQ